MKSISCLILNYNQKHHVIKLIDYALNQTVPFDEIIIIDDKSTDGSLQTIQNYIKNKHKITALCNPTNTGTNESLLRALNLATSEFVFLMSSNISYSRELVEMFRCCLQKHPNAIMMAGQVRVTHKSKKEQTLKLPFPVTMTSTSPSSVMEQLSKRIFTFYGGANVMHKEKILQNEFFIKNLKWHADWFLYLMLSLSGEVALTRKVIATYGIKLSRFSDGMHEASQQIPVTCLYLDTLLEKKPIIYADFKTAAVLPYYSIRTLLALIRNKKHRNFISAKLIFRCLVYWPLRYLSKVIPNRFRNKLRILIQL